jgi:hypothetical protein
LIEARTFSRKQAGLRFARHHAWWHSSAGSLRAGVQSLISRDDGKRKRRDRSNKKKRTTALTLSQTAQSPPTDHGGVGSVWLRRTAHAARHERGGRRGASHDSCVTSRRNESVRRSVCAQRSHAGVAWSVAIVLCGSPCGVCRDENGTGTRNGYRIRVPKRDEFSDTETGILFGGTDTGTTRILAPGYG